MGKLLSDQTKYELAQELGFADQVTHGNSLYFGNVSSKNCGNFVKLAISKTQQSMV